METIEHENVKTFSFLAKSLLFFFLNEWMSSFIFILFVLSRNSLSWNVIRNEIFYVFSPFLQLFCKKIFNELERICFSRHTSVALNYDWITLNHFKLSIKSSYVMNVIKMKKKLLKINSWIKKEMTESI